EENEFNRAGLFTSQEARVFAEFLEPLMLPSLDAGLRVSIVEGAVRDRAVARTGLVELRRQAHAAFGGFFEHGAALVVVRSPEPDEAVRLRSEEHTSELQSPYDIVCRLL